MGFPAAVGPVRTISGFFIIAPLYKLYNTFKFLFQFCFSHGNNRRSSMRTVIGVLQCEQFIDQGICFPVGHLVISLYRSLTCHGGQSGSKDSKWIISFSEARLSSISRKSSSSVRPYRLAGTALIQYSLPPNGSISNPKSSKYLRLALRRASS